MSQPTEKRADELNVGDHVHDGRGMGPVEVAYTQQYRNAHGDQRVLLVTTDAATSHHMPGDVFPLATKAEMADAVRYRDRVRAIADIRALADWWEQHPDLPAPLSVDVRIVVPETTMSNAQRRAAVAEIAAAMGVEVAESGKTVSASYQVAAWTPARVEVLASVWLYDEPTPDEFAEASARAAEPEPEPEPQDQTLPHYEARAWKDGDGSDGGCGVECACGTTFDGFDSLAEASALLSTHIKEGNAAAAAMLETPLDELPADFGADHQPQLDCCEDCDAELDAAVEQAEASGLIEDAAGPVYADSVNGEEL